MNYSTPIVGTAFKPFSNQSLQVSSSETNDWKLYKLIEYKNQSYVLFRNNKGQEIMQATNLINRFRRKFGENHSRTNLTNAQAIEIFERTQKGEKPIVVAVEYSISPKIVSNIKHLKSWRKVINAHLNKDKPKPEVPIIPKRAINKKLSPNIAEFIRKDKNINKLSTKDIAKKYCVTERTVQRIVKGEMYASKPITA